MGSPVCLTLAFTAAQAAQKYSSNTCGGEGEFTAAQAAQKVTESAEMPTV